MPNPLNSVAFTPNSDGTLMVTATYSVQQTGTASDWGGTDPGVRMTLRKQSDLSVLATSPKQTCTRTRMSQVYRTSFSCLASNGPQVVWFEGVGGAPSTSVLVWDVLITAELIKR